MNCLAFEQADLAAHKCELCGSFGHREITCEAKRTDEFRLLDDEPMDRSTQLLLTGGGLMSAAFWTAVFLLLGVYLRWWRL